MAAGGFDVVEEPKGSHERRQGAVRADRADTAVWAVFTAILAITGLFHFYRGAPVDGMVFCAVALICLLARRTDASRTHHRSFPDFVARAARHPLVGPFTVLLGTALVIVLMVAPRYSHADVVVFAVLTLLILGTAARPARHCRNVRLPARPTRRAVVLWSVLVVAFSACELVAYFLSTAGPAAEQQHPPLSDALSPLLDSAVGRLVFLVCWLIVGRGLGERLGLLPGRSTADRASDTLPRSGR